MTGTLHIDCDSIHGTFRQWQAEQEPLSAQLAESLSALSAYQSHLDAWQQQLVKERDELRENREQLEQFDLERAAAGQSQPSSEMTAELRAAHEKIATLTSTLESRGEELRVLREQLEHLRELVERRSEGVESDAPIEHHEVPREVKTPERTPERKPENPVFASVREQFGKLRQQRASMERPGVKKVR